MLHGCRQFLFYAVWLNPKKIETCIYIYNLLKLNIKKIFNTFIEITNHV